VNHLNPISPDQPHTMRADTVPAEDRADQEKRAIIEILQLVTRTEDLHELAAALIAYIRDWTGCEAAALRLRRGEDFPFLATEGFPEKLLRAENSLCGFNEKGEIIRDESGRPVLECICGCVLCGALGKHRPFLTEDGGFCVTSSTQFIVEHERNLPENIRGKCVEQGYESIAIIPLRLDNEPYGLLHLCDHRRGLFDDSTLTVLEGLADSLAVALAHREAQQAVRRHELSLRALASRLAMTEEQERRRIATVLHDDLCQTLAFARMRLNSLRKDDLSLEASAVTGEIEDLLREAIDFTRDLTVELCPPVLYQQGLAAALAWLADRTAARHGLKVQCDCDSACLTDAEVGTIIFRSVRELLANVLKYAQATSVRIWMECADDALQIGVSDDGVGFDSREERAHEDNGGFGLFSIREALAHIGGHLEVLSSPGQGTTCILNVPRDPAE
jgi:signal transduction histidine kinase